MKAALFFFAMTFLFSASPAFAETRNVVFPVAGEYSFRNDFAEPRDGGAREHLGIDIIADKMTPLVAAVDGRISFIAIPQASWGYSISIVDADGYSYRYLHMNNDTPGTDDGQGGETNAYAPGLLRGSSVTRGQIIGWVGDSGNAEATVSHLHFEIRNPSRTAVNPYDSLIAASGGQSAGVSVPILSTGHEAGLEEEEEFIIRRQLQEGEIDRAVASLHTELKTLGYYSGGATETYDATTREAVRKFQAANGIAPTGIADARTLRAITTLAAKAPQGGSSSSSGTGATSSSLSRGASGEAVRAVQARLKELGFFDAEPTGYFGAVTEASVVAFQKANNIDAIGIVGPKTKAALDAAKPKTSAAETPPPPPAATAGGGFTFTLTLQKGARGEEVRELQIALARDWYFREEATGYFGSVTEAAVIAFQKANGIEPLGIVGPKTRAALNGKN